MHRDPAEDHHPSEAPLQDQSETIKGASMETGLLHTC